MFDLELNGEIGYWAINSQDVNYELKKLTGDIKISFNSNGGSTIEGIAIFNAFREYEKNKGKIELTILSIGASMGSYIPLACSKVIVYDNTTFMIHNARIFTGGDQNHLRKIANTVEGFSNILKSEYIKKTGKNEKEIKSAMDKETFYFGQEIIDMGFADEIITSGEELDKTSALLVAKASFDETMKNTEARMKDEPIDKMVAILEEYNTTLRVNSASAQIENKNQGEQMNDETTSTVEASNVQTAEATISQDAAVAVERRRVSEIMALGGNQEFTSKAIQEGTSAGEAAIALLTTDKNNLVAAKTNQEAVRAKANFEAAAEEVSEVATSEATIEDAEAKAWKEAEDKVYGGKK